MDSIKLNLRTPLHSIGEIFFSSATINLDENISILFNKKDDMFDLSKGEALALKRYVYNKDGVNFITKLVDIIDMDIDNKTMVLSQPVNDLIRIKKIYSANTISEDFSIIELESPHYIFLQDINFQKIIFYDSGREIVGDKEGYGVKIVFKRQDVEVTSADCITNTYNEVECNDCEDDTIVHEYEYCPEQFSNTSIIVNVKEKDIPTGAIYVSLKYTPFYYFDENNNVCFWKDSIWETYSGMTDNCIKYINKGNSRVVLGKNDAFWRTDLGISLDANDDTLGSDDTFENQFVEDLKESLIPDFIDMERYKYSPVTSIDTSDNDSNKTLVYKWSYAIDNEDYGVTIITSANCVYTKELWGAEKNGEEVDVFYDEKCTRKIDGFVFDSFNDNGKIVRILYGEITIIEGDVKTSYSNGGYIYNNEVIVNDNIIATAITLNFHFRKRKEIEDDKRTENTTFTSGNVYYDKWYINPDEDEITWWNGFNYSASTFSANDFEDFYIESGTTSDLIGYLNFTDNDVYFRKKKVSQSFIRLLFYNSMDPVEQKLLYYSTVFLDGGILYGKYLKQLNDSNSGKLSLNNENENCKVVLTRDGDNPVDTRLVITNEFDRTKSAEGFNLYLFAEDHNLLDENGEKTIYMRVEFNHAGNGKTIPMIMWPKRNNVFVPLTTENFIESLYIPVKISYLNGRYVYYIPTANTNDGNIELILFEPKLDMLPDTKNDGDN